MRIPSPPPMLHLARFNGERYATNPQRCVRGSIGAGGTAADNPAARAIAEARNGSTCRPHPDHPVGLRTTREEAHVAPRLRVRHRVAPATKSRSARTRRHSTGCGCCLASWSMSRVSTPARLCSASRSPFRSCSRRPRITASCIPRERLQPFAAPARLARRSSRVRPPPPASRRWPRRCARASPRQKRRAFGCGPAAVVVPALRQQRSRIHAQPGSTGGILGV